MATHSQRAKIIEEYFELMDAFKRMHAGPHGVWSKQNAKVTRAQLGIMMLIERHNLTTVQAIADHLGISPSAATQMVNELVKGKFLKRTPDTTDRRKVLLALTASGKEVMNTMYADMKKMFTKLFQALTDTELKTLVALQRKMVEHLSQNQSE